MIDKKYNNLYRYDSESGSKVLVRSINSNIDNQLTGTMFTAFAVATTILSVFTIVVIR